MKTTLITTSVALLLLAGTVTASKHLSAVNEPKHSRTTKLVPAAIPKVLEFDFAQRSIRKSYLSNLDLLASQAIKDNILVSLAGHADSVGAYKPNWVLSDKRAIMVKDYLVSKGVKQERIVTTPYGSTVPIASNKTAEGRQHNRRVEISLKKAGE
jgi:outer membrane protein OmpA-like peptidoglycan-associated protein